MHWYIFLSPRAKLIPVIIHLCTSVTLLSCTGLRSLAVSCSKSEVEQCVSSLNCLNLLTSLSIHLTATDELVEKVEVTLGEQLTPSGPQILPLIPFPTFLMP